MLLFLNLFFRLIKTSPSNLKTPKVRVRPTGIAICLHVIHPTEGQAPARIFAEDHNIFRQELTCICRSITHFFAGSQILYFIVAKTRICVIYIFRTEVTTSDELRLHVFIHLRRIIYTLPHDCTIARMGLARHRSHRLGDKTS